MSDIEKKISLKGLDQVLSDFQKLQNEVSELKNRNRELRQTSEGNASETMSELKGMAAQYLSVGAAVGLVTRGIQEQLAEQEKMGRVYEENNQKLVQQLALTNQLKNIGRIEEFVNSSANQTQARAFLGGVMSSAPNMPIEQQFAIAKGLEPAANVLTEDQASQTGRLAGAFGRLGITNPESVAIMAQRDAGGNAEALLGDRTLRNMGNMIRAGLDPAAAVALNVAAVNNDMGGKWAGGLVDALLMDDQAKPDDSPRKRAFLRDNNAGSRLSSLMGDPKTASEILGATKALEIGRSSVDTLQRMTTAYGNASGIPGSLEAEALASDAGADVVGERKATAMWDKRRRERGAALDPYADARSQFDAAIVDQGVEDGWGSSVTTLLRRVENAVSTRVSSAMGYSASDYATERLVNKERRVGGWGSSSPETLKILEESLRVQGLINEELLIQLRKQNGVVSPAPSRSIHGE